MRTVILILVCLSMLSQVAVAKPSTISIDIGGKPLPDAVKILFEAGGESYSLDPSAGNSIVNLSIKNAPFVAALDTFCQATRLTYKLSGGIYRLSPKKPVDPDSDDNPASAYNRMEERYGVVTMDLPGMNLRDALWKVDPETAQTVQLTDAVTPEASFYYFPKKIAADILIHRATGAPLHVDIKTISMIQAILPQFVSVAAYRAQGAWKLIILANQAKPVDLVSALFKVTRTNFVVVGGGSAALGGGLAAMQPTGPEVTVQLIGVSLDEALETILPTLNMTCTKKGRAYFIGPAPDKPTEPKPN